MIHTNCFACDKRIKGADHIPTAVTNDNAQIVYVGPDCYRKIKSAGLKGYQPPKGGPKLYMHGILK